MDSWLTLDLWVNPYSIIVLAIQNMMKAMSFNITVGSSENFIMLYMLRMQAVCQYCAVSNQMDSWLTPNLWNPMASFVKIAVIYAKVLEYICYAVSGSVYGETAPLTTVCEAILCLSWIRG